MNKVYLVVGLDQDKVVGFELHETIGDAEEWVETLREMSPFRLIIFEINTSSGKVWKHVDRSEV